MNANVYKKITNSKLHMAGITQNKQKCLVSLWSFEAGTVHKNSKKGR